jgi:hypothetical protein
VTLGCYADVQKSTSTRRQLVGEKRKEKEMANSHVSLRDKTEENFVAELKSKSTLELYQFMVGPWTASILSPEAIEELYRYLKLRIEETPQQEDAEIFVGLD